ncbi:hypothetical protein Tco_1369999 [Tanacetum coccineum]
MGNEELSTIPEKESDKFIKSNVEDLVPILSKSEDTPESDSDCDLPSCDDFSLINGFEEKIENFSNPLFDLNSDFTSSNDESLSDEDVPEDNVKIYSNPLFKFNDEYISSDVNSLFDEVLENIESKESYVYNLDEPTLLVTPISDANKDECFEPGGEIDEIDSFLDMDISTDIENGYHDSEGDIIYLESLLINDTITNLHCEKAVVLVVIANMDLLVYEVGLRWERDVFVWGVCPVFVNHLHRISEKTNNAGTSQTPKAIASEEKDEEVELIVVPSAVKIPEEKDESRTSSTNSKQEETLPEPQKEKKDSSTDSLEDNSKIQAFRRELEEIALKHLGTVPENNTTSTPSSFMTINIEVNPTPTLRIHNIHPKSQILGDPKSAVQTRSKV